MYSWPEILVPFAWSQSRVSWDDLKTTTKKTPFWIAKKPKFLDSALGGKFCLNKYRYLHFQLCHQLHLKCQKVVVRMVEMSHFPLFFHKSIKKNLPSLKLTSSLHLEMDGWNTRTFPFGDSAYCQVRTCCSFQGLCIS